MQTDAANLLSPHAGRGSRSRLGLPPRVLAALVLLLPATAFADPSPGKLVPLVRQDCGSCHGLTLKGGLGAPLLPESLKGQDEDSLADIILGGIPGTPMPPWRGLLSDEDAHWIAHKLKEGFPQ